MAWKLSLRVAGSTVPGVVLSRNAHKLHVALKVVDIRPPSRPKGGRNPYVLPTSWMTWRRNSSHTGSLFDRY